MAPQGDGPGGSGSSPPQHAGGTNAARDQAVQPSPIEQQLRNDSGPPEEPVQ